jgi:DNA-binding NtrC family response regulator
MAKAKILLAEDDLIMVSLLQTLLKMEGYEVVVLQSDADIPAAVRREHPDALLLDVYLSDQSGLDVLDQLQNSEDTSGVRVIMSSGANVRDECMQRGAFGFLPKPYMPDDLVQILKEAIRTA